MTTPQAAPDPGAIPEFHMGDRMAKALDHAGIGRAEMADYLGVSTETIRRWVTLSTPVKRAALLAWASVTNVSLEWLEHGDDLRARRDSNPKPSDQEPGLVDHSPTRSGVSGLTLIMGAPQPPICDRCGVRHVSSIPCWFDRDVRRDLTPDRVSRPAGALRLVGAEAS